MLECAINQKTYRDPLQASVKVDLREKVSNPGLEITACHPIYNDICDGEDSTSEALSNDNTPDMVSIKLTITV